MPTIGLPKNRRSPVYCPTLTRLTIAPSIHLACAALRARLNVQIADGLDWFINMRLIGIGAVTSDEVAAWKQMRHRAAHADLPDSQDVQAFLGKV